MNGTLARYALFSLALSSALVACGRSPRVRSEAEMPAQSPAKDTAKPPGSPRCAGRTHPTG